jgi:hypothetical protein
MRYCRNWAGGEAISPFSTGAQADHVPPACRERVSKVREVSEGSVAE